MAKKKTPETAPAAAASSGEVLFQPVDIVQQAEPVSRDVSMSEVKVTLKQDLLLNGRMYRAGGTYMLPEDAFGVFKYAMVTEE